MATYSFTNSKVNFPSFAPVNPAGPSKSAAVVKKYDERYEKQAEATFAGVFLLAAPVMFTFFSFMSSVQYYGLETFIQVMAIGGLVLRVIATKWVSSIATEQNRNASKWMALSFFLPATSLIIMGQTKKLNKVAPAAKKAGFTFNAESLFKHIAQPEKMQMAS